MERARVSTLPVVLSVIGCLTTPVLAQPGSPTPDEADPPPQTRREALRRQREQRGATVHPYQPGRLERLLSSLENEQTVEDLFERPSPTAGGYYLTLGNITTGAGLTLGTGYNARARFGQQLELSVRGAVSQRLYWMGELEAAFPRLADGRAFASVLARRADYTQEDFYGPGPNSRFADRVSFRHLQTSIEATAGFGLSPWLSVGGGLAYLNPRIGVGTDSRYPSIEQAFTDDQAPGLLEQPDFVRGHVFADFDLTTPSGRPRTGGRYLVAYHAFTDTQLSRYSFERWVIDLRQFVSFLRGRRVVALRGLGSFSSPRSGHTVPFYLQDGLGGSHTLRGFRDFRLRDRHLLLFQAEYRWELFPELDAVLFYDTGKVASIRRELNLKEFDTNWGTGFRIGTERGVFFRVDWALGGRDGQHLMVKFSDVF